MKAIFSVISSRAIVKSSPSQISNMLQAGYEPVQNLSSVFVKWSYAVVVITNHSTTNFFPPQLFAIVLNHVLI